MIAIEPNIVRVGWRQVGYEVSAEEAQRHHRFQWISFSFLAIPSILMMVLYGQHGDPMLSLSSFWWEFSCMIAGVTFVGVSSRLVNYAYLKNLIRDKRPNDSGFTFFERRLKLAMERWRINRWAFWVMVIVMPVNLFSDEPNGTLAFVTILLTTATLEVLYFRYLSGAWPPSLSEASK